VGIVGRKSFEVLCNFSVGGSSCPDLTEFLTFDKFLVASRRSPSKFLRHGDSRTATPTA
jgi:hypothetical protein